MGAQTGRPGVGLSVTLVPAGGPRPTACFCFLSQVGGSRHFVAAAPAVYSNRRFASFFGAKPMNLTVEAVYQDGVLKPTQPLPLKENERVRVSIHTTADVQNALDAVQRSYGLLHWTGDVEDLRRVAEDDEFGILESP